MAGFKELSIDLKFIKLLEMRSKEKLDVGKN